MPPTTPPRQVAPRTDAAVDSEELRRLETALLTVVRLVMTRTPSGPEALDKAGYVTLVGLERCGPARLSDLAAGLLLDLSTVSRQVKSLEAQGLVARSGDPDDRRANVVDLTEAGRARLAGQRAARWEGVVRALGELTSEHRDGLIRLFERIAAAVHDESRGEAR